MTKDEILRYIILCVSYKHNNDISPYITKSGEEKEDLLFESAIEFLEKLDKENAELKKDLKSKDLALEDFTKWSEARLTKAKELLTKCVELYKPKLEGYPIPPIQEQTEQFLEEE